MSQLTRRTLLKAGAATVLGAAFSGSAASLLSGAATAPKWPGHQPGQIYLGMSTGGAFASAMSSTGPVGLYRSYYGWNNAKGEDNNIAADHAARRMPWISFKPPTTNTSTWRDIANGRYDADFQARARRHATYSKPVIVTFNHEPQNDNYGSPADFAAAWTRIYDVMNAATGLKNVVFAPIIGDWVFNPVNRQDDPENYLTTAVLSRTKMLGIDLYQNPSGETYEPRLGRILSWLDSRGFPQITVGLGETGCSDFHKNTTALKWWNTSWSYAVSRSDRVAAISYFNSQRNSRSGVNWALTETPAKLQAFKAALGSSTACRLA